MPNHNLCFFLACPYLITPPWNIKANQSSVATFFCDGDAVPTFNITWRFKGRKIKNSRKYTFADENRNLIIHNVQDSDAGDYTCVVGSPYGQQTAKAKLHVMAVTGK